MATAKTTDALVQNDKQELVLRSVPLPAPTGRQLLISVSFVAQNPTDPQSLDMNLFGEGTVLGCDVVGRVEAIGEGVRRFHVGDSVAGLLWGGENKGIGGCAKHTIVSDERIAFKLGGGAPQAEGYDEVYPAPADADPAAMASIPLAAATSELALFSERCLALAKAEPPASGLIPAEGKGAKVLIWGGASSVGFYAIQLARLSGLRPYAVASSSHHAELTSLGAVRCLDYKKDDVVALLQDEGIKHAYDCIGSVETSRACSQIVRDGTLCTVRPGRGNTQECLPQTKVTDVLVWTVWERDQVYGPHRWPARKKDHALGRELFRRIPRWLATSELKPNHVKRLKGLESVQEGFELYRQKAYSNVKLVYEL